MSSNATSMVRSWDWRRILFTIFAGVVAFFLLTNLFRLAAPWASMTWYPHDDPRQLDPDLHRWHEAMWGAVTGILEGCALLALLWRPRENTLLIQFIALAALGAAILVLPFEPSLLFVIVMLALVVLAYPFPRALVDFSGEEPTMRSLLGLSVAAALLLMPYIVRLVFWQINRVGGEHAAANQWISDVEHSTFLLLGMFLASTKRPGWQILGTLSGITLSYLGVAALALPNYAGSWGRIGGVFALIGGLLFMAATRREARKSIHRPSKALPSAV